MLAVNQPDGFGAGHSPIYSHKPGPQTGGHASWTDQRVPVVRMDENHFPILWRHDGYRTPGI